MRRLLRRALRGGAEARKAEGTELKMAGDSTSFISVGRVLAGTEENSLGASQHLGR